MGRRASTTVILCFLGLCAAPVGAHADTFVFRAAEHQDSGVRFELEAPLAKIEAKAPGLEGEVSIEAGRARGRFRLRVDRIETGIEGRDRDLRKPGWLDARRWPHIGFVFEEFATPSDLLAGGTHEVLVRGRIILHGVERAQSVKLRLRFDDEEKVLHCEGSFVVRLEDHRIQRTDSAAKKLLGLSVGETATVRLELRGRRG